MHLLELPLDVAVIILATAVLVHPKPANVLAVHSTWFRIALPFLHSDLKFNSIEKLALFANGTSPLARCKYRTVQIVLPGGAADTRLWTIIQRILQRCQGNEGESTVTSVHFTMNSLASDPTLHLIADALKTISPSSFTWTGPDPENNFSCAIVPAATGPLLTGIAPWSNLQHLSLSSISFSRCKGATLLTLTPFSHPALKSIHISQGVFLAPRSIALLALQLPALTRIQLVDVYQESIWGPRVRIADIEHEVAPGVVDPELGVWEGTRRIREIVTCEAKSERLIGGDRDREMA
ncbi:hypothetical protein SISSUDRAFT_1050134, partial [Sistotremastrum suecicum HHB10207 ss-3]